MRLISNSETSSWLQCSRKYYYEYVLDLEPKSMSEAINKGLLIHTMLEYYYADKAAGFDEDTCRASTSVPIIEAAQARKNISNLNNIQNLIIDYFDTYLERNGRYEIVAIETKYRAELTDNFAMVGTLDLLLKDKEDDRLVTVNHKSTYNF